MTKKTVGTLFVLFLVFPFEALWSEAGFPGREDGTDLPIDPGQARELSRTLASDHRLNADDILMSMAKVAPYAETAFKAGASDSVREMYLGTLSVAYLQYEKKEKPNRLFDVLDVTTESFIQSVNCQEGRPIMIDLETNDGELTNDPIFRTSGTYDVKVVTEDDRCEQVKLTVSVGNVAVYDCTLHCH